MSYDRTNIIENYRGLIGFRPTLDASNVDAAIDKELSVSDSGEYINNFHALFTPENFSDAAQQFNQFSQDPWSSSTTYLKKQVVEYEDSVYVALIDNLNKQPDTNTDEWKQTTLLSEWFRDVYDYSVLDSISAILTQKKIEGHGRQLRGSTALFSTNGAQANLVTKSSRKVGFEIKVLHQGVGFVLERIGLQLNQSSSVPIHIMFRGEDRIETLQYTFNKTFQYFDIKNARFLAYEGPLWIYYEEDDLGAASAIYQSTQIFQGGCGTCGGLDQGSQKQWNKYVSIVPIEIDSSDNITYPTSTNFGMNLAMSFVCDFSDYLIRNSMMVVPLLKQRLIKAFLEQLANSTRANVVAENVSNLAFNELKDYSNPEHPSTVTKRELRGLSFELSGFGYAPCLSCQKTKIRDSVI